MPCHLLFVFMHFLSFKEGSKAVCLLLHGDAAFSGQGVVTESLMMSRLPAYTTDGVIHIVVNNQV